MTTFYKDCDDSDVKRFTYRAAKTWGDVSLSFAVGTDTGTAKWALSFFIGQCSFDVVYLGDDGLVHSLGDVMLKSIDDDVDDTEEGLEDLMLWFEPDSFSDTSPGLHGIALSRIRELIVL